MKTTLKLAAIPAALLITTSLAHASEGATVYNHADGQTCVITLSNAAYTGDGTLVQTPKGRVNAQCDATLIAGTPVDMATRTLGVTAGSPFGPLPCDIVETPLGNASMTCHRP
jgi:hypothetical protein